ncbi:MAG TPA: hypothetical protein VMS93_12730 [Candidatus Saccharimonadales bacterium]|nr:hypothetical protein [Candidatus Saccharimonadales bacterium]
MEFQLLDHNLALLRHLPGLVRLLAAALAAWCLVGPGWGRKPACLRRGFLVTLAPLSLGLMLFGQCDELRVYYEVYPFVFLLALPTVATLLTGQSLPAQKATGGIALGLAASPGARREAVAG